MSKYIYSNKVASKRALQSLTINSLMGVDYSSSMVNIRDYHAYDIKNFLKKNNVLRNRNGFEQVGKGKINGIWECNFKGRRIFVVHCGTKLYYVKSIEDLNTYDIESSNYHEIKIKTIAGVNIPLVTISNKPSWGVFANDRLYLLTGEYNVLKFTDDIEEVDNDWTTMVMSETDTIYCKLCKVAGDKDTYVPTTTIGITYNNNNVAIQRTTLDDPNMLTTKRINTISTIVGEGEEANYNDFSNPILRYYKLDQFISHLHKVELSFIDNSNVTKTIDVKIEISQTTSGNFDVWDLYVNKTDLGITVEEGQPTTIRIGYAVTDNFFLYYDFKQPNKLEDNLIVTFSVDSSDADLINKCTFGIVYGANGNRNRLFLSGNPEKPNVDYHSGRRNIYATEGDIDLEDSQDFTYFSVYDYNAYGTSNSAVTDYQIMGNGDLMVIKEHNINEPNIYFRSGRFDTNEQGYTVETYPSRVGNIGTGSLIGQRGTLKNLNNDLVFVSPLGIYGISSTVSAGMLNSDYQYAYARSNLINSKLKPYFDRLQAITAIIHDNKYFCTLKLKNGEFKTFVADGRYAYKLEESIDNEYEYEWFVLDNINAEKYYEINGVLYFTNDNGFFKLDLAKEVEQHIDITKYAVVNGEITVDDSDDGSDVVISQDLIKNLDDSSVFTITGDDIYVKSFVRATKGVANVASKLVRDYFEDTTNEIYIATTLNGVITLKRRIYAYEQEDEYNVYNLCSKPNTVDTSIDGGYTLLFKVKNKGFTFNYVRDKNNTITDVSHFIDIYGNRVTLTDSQLSTTLAFTGFVTNTKNVDCLFVTKAYNMGQSLYNKNLKSITVVNDAESYSWVNFAIRTKEVKKRFDENIVSGTSGLTDTYQNIFKADLTDSSFATSFTKNYYLKFNFIQFEFYNNNGSDCIINNINVIYTLGFNQGGVS